MTITDDNLRKCIVFQSVDRISPHLKTCFQDNFCLSNIDREPIVDIGEITTIDKKRIFTKNVTLPPNFGDALLVDIGYGCNAGIYGIKYTLLVVDWATCYKYIYGLKSLKHGILPAAIKHLLDDIWRTPLKLVTNYDHKLMGSQVTNHLNNIKCTLESAPPRHQHQNGMFERNWRPVTHMAQGWLNSALLPSQFWFYAIKRALEVSNYLPIKNSGINTTPFELVHHIKLDTRTLIPMVWITYIDKTCDNTSSQ